MSFTRAFQSPALRILVAVGWLAAIVGLGGSVQSGAAQESSDTSYVLETTGDEITWDEPWRIEPDIEDSGDGFEVVGFSSDTSSLLISVIPNDLDIEEARDATLEVVSDDADSFTIVDRGAYENISYALDIATYDGAELGVFTLFRGGSGSTPTFVYVFIGGITSFSEGFDSAQDTFQVSGDPIFTGVEGQGLEDLLAQNSGGGGETSATEEPTEPSTDDPTEEATDEPGNDPTDKLNKETTSQDRDQEIDDEYVDLGVTSQGKYESPQHGTSIVWGETWALDVEASDPVISDEAQGLDGISLAWQGEGAALISVNLLPAGDAAPADFVAIWSSDEFLSDTASPDSEILLSDSGRDIGGVVLRDFLESGIEVVVYREAQLLGDGETIALITYFSEPVAIPDAISDATEEIELEGEPVLAIFDSEDVAAEFE